MVGNIIEESTDFRSIINYILITANACNFSITCAYDCGLYQVVDSNYSWIIDICNKCNLHMFAKVKHNQITRDILLFAYVGK